MEWFILMLLGITSSFFLLKPYEERKPENSTGLTRMQRIKRQFLRL